MAYITRRKRKEIRKNKIKKIIIAICGLLILLATSVIYLGFRYDSGKTKKEIISNSDTDSSSEIIIPEYSGEPYAYINENVPLFSESDRQLDVFESYSQLDEFGRCQMAFANICPELMPTEERGNIGNIKPSGWKQAKYEGVVNSKPPYLYNRCHLIAFCLAGENDNELNLITGTRYMNVEGMLPWEEKVARYVDKSGNHVLYRVTPDFVDEELVARGVLIEALSLEDAGEGISFCVYCYNVQPGVSIDYMTGESRLE